VWCGILCLYLRYFLGYISVWVLKYIWKVSYPALNAVGIQSAGVVETLPRLTWVSCVLLVYSLAWNHVHVTWLSVHAAFCVCSVKMVLMWSCGDIFKTSYFVLRQAPTQFWLCGSAQVMLDFAIMMQVFYYSASQGVHRRASDSNFAGILAASWLRVVISKLIFGICYIVSGIVSGICALDVFLLTCFLFALHLLH